MVELRSKQGVKIVKTEQEYSIFVNALKIQGGFIHGSQSHVDFEHPIKYAIFIYWEAPLNAEVK